MKTSGLFFKNAATPKVPLAERGRFFITEDGCRLFIHTHCPVKNYHCTIYIIAGITGINHDAEKDLIAQLSNGSNRVVTIHPRGTGYSEGKRGDIVPFAAFINDYKEIICNDTDYKSGQHKLFLFGHSMAAAVLLAMAGKLKNISGAILANPPLLRKKARGMSPGIGQYFKYAWYFLFNRHQPVVNMAGDPSLIEDEEDRKESIRRLHDPLLVSYFSMYMMAAAGKLLRSMLRCCKRARYPLLLLYGTKDSIVDKKGCDQIYKNWKHPDKQYVLVQNGTHGKSTITLAKAVIEKWMEEH